MKESASIARGNLVRASARHRTRFAALHRRIALFGGVATLIWCLSGLLHPLMTSYGPQQAQFMPPRAELALQGVQPVHETLRAAQIASAVAVRVVAGEPGQLLQVTVDPDAPRRYFDLNSGEELPGMDARQALFLARHYLGESVSDADVLSTELLTDFTAEYPWVNRLLPVYRVAFATPDRLVAFVYTETNTLAAVNNRFKERVQTAFRWLHTWDWIPQQLELVRVLLIGFMVGSLALLALSGLGMLVRIRRPRRATGVRGWHRAAAWVFLLPLLALSVSGIYHLLQASIDTPGRTLRFGEPLDLDAITFNLHSQWSDISAGVPIESVSIVSDADGALLYRLGLRRDSAATPRDAASIRGARFAGVPATGPALYLNAATGEAWQPGDRELALQLAEAHSGVGRSAFKKVELVTRFGPEYDFRNKRLPVWQVDVAAPVNATLFIDTATGVLADRVANAQKPERLSFSLLHKWNFLLVFGRQAQTIIVVVTVTAAMCFMAGLGLLMHWRRRRRGA